LDAAIDDVNANARFPPSIRPLAGRHAKGRVPDWPGGGKRWQYVSQAIGIA
jgi:hypothetical protein